MKHPSLQLTGTPKSLPVLLPIQTLVKVMQICQVQLVKSMLLVMLHVTEVMQLRYISEELNIQFPRPVRLQRDNTAAKAFTNNIIIRTKLTHIDVRTYAKTDWVRCWRDRSLLVPAHVPSAANLDDFFTQILPAPTFIRLRLGRGIQ